MNFLIIHQNFPGQFRHIALHLLASGHQVLGLGLQSAPGLQGVALVRYKLKRGTTKGIHRYVAPLENGVIYGQSVAEALLALQQKGFKPDVILAHPGWGEALFVKEVFPNVPLIGFFEFFYKPHGADVGFDPMFPVNLDDFARIRAKNALHLLNLETCDYGVSPTQWQKSLHPTAYQPRISIIHEGIDTEFMQPDAAASFTLPNGLQLHHGDQVLTYVARNLEPYRGFHVFMRALPDILRRNPQLQVVIVGGDDVSYGAKPSDADNWREAMLREVGAQLDLQRVHFLGKIPYADYRRVLQVSAAHVYLTYPFVLSWSMLEAMSCGCVMIGSATAPVQEVLEDGINGHMVGFFDQSALVERVTDVLAHPQEQARLRIRARATVLERYTVQQGISGYCQLLGLPLLPGKSGAHGL